MKHRFARTVSVVMSAALLVGVLASPSASGSPIDDKQAEAVRLQNQIEANGDRIAALGEQYNGAQIAYDQATAQILEAKRRYEEARAEMERIRGLIRNRAAELYKGAGARSPLEAMEVDSVSEMGARQAYAAAAADRDDRLMDKLQVAKEWLEVERQSLERDQAEARAQKDAAAVAKRDIEAANAQQQQLLATVKGQLATLLEQERARREAAARAAAVARIGSGGRTPARGAVDPGSVGGGFPDVPAPSPGVAAVIAYARAQLGKPYVFATAGPDTFDCSGLTMMAWRQAGVSMAHFSGAQFNAFPHIPISALQPGDLVFKGPGGRDHVALYIGGGMQIAATHTGDFVRLQPVGSNLSGAVRPG